MLLPGCSDDASCGPSEEAAGIEATVGTMSATFSSFTAGANNDCPNAGSPTSVTVSGSQEGDSGSVILCLSQPEVIGDSSLEVSYDGPVQLVSVAVQLDCPVIVDRSMMPALSATFSGFCGDGVDPAGFTLALEGTVPATKQCQGQPDEAVTISLDGSATVLPE